MMSFKKEEDKLISDNTMSKTAENSSSNCQVSISEENLF